MNCIAKNSKTIESVDFTTDCPKRREGKACVYCYVEAARRAGYNAKTVIDYACYAGEVKRYSKAKIAKLNAAGGIRLFSFGDYMAEHDQDIKSFLMDCEAVGLQVKVITKQPDFIHKFHDFKAIRVIHISVDAINHGVDHDVAKDLRSRYNKVLIRCAIMRDEDVKTLDFADILTFNHARGLAQFGYRLYRPAKVQEWAGKLPGKVCCTTGECATCPIKCGLISTIA